MVKDTRKSKSFVISKEELNYLIKNTHGRDRLIIVALGLAGMREGELAHMRRSWIYSDHIKIPKRPQLCDCVDCQLQAFFAEKRGKVKKDVNWYPKLQKKFFRLRSGGKLKNLKFQWTPTSDSGARNIPFKFKVMRKTFVKWFYSHDRIGMTRQGIWQRVRTLGDKIIGKRLYPTALRSSFATMLADEGASKASLQANMGWAKIDSTVHYVKPKKK